MEIAFKHASSPKATLGNQGELFVVDWLKKNNFTILTCNYRTKHGEVDIIAQQKKIVAFVEVKLRSKRYFNLSEVITKSKQKKIIITAQEYAVRNLKNIASLILRFDVALLHKHNETFSLEYIPDAFTKNCDW